MVSTVDVPGLNLGPETVCFNICRDFMQFRREDTGVVPHIRSRLLPCTFSLIIYILVL
jgi:hypothetical protein